MCIPGEILHILHCLHGSVQLPLCSGKYFGESLILLPSTLYEEYCSLQVLIRPHVPTSTLRGYCHLWQLSHLCTKHDKCMSLREDLYL